MAKIPNILKPVTWLLQRAWFWFFLTTIALALIFRSEVHQFADDLTERYQYQLELDKLRNDFQRSQTQRDFFMRESESRRREIENYEKRLTDLDFQLSIERHKIQSGLHDGSLEDGPLASVTVQTLWSIDRMASEIE